MPVEFPTNATRKWPSPSLALLCLAAWLGAGAARAHIIQPSPGEGANLPAAVIELLEAAPLPALAVDPARRHGLLVHERGLLSIAALAEPMLEIAHWRINPQTYGPHAPLGYHGFTLVDLWTGERMPIPIPADVTVGFPRWSPDGSRFAFTVTRTNGIELWVGDPDTARARRLLGPVLNATTGTPCTWMPDSRNLLCRVIAREAKITDVAPQGLWPYLPLDGQGMLQPRIRQCRRCHGWSIGPFY